MNFSRFTLSLSSWFFSRRWIGCGITASLAVLRIFGLFSPAVLLMTLTSWSKTSSSFVALC